MRTPIYYEERSGWAWWAHLAFSVTFVAAVIPLSELARGEVWGEGDAMPVAVAFICLILGFGIPAAIYLFMGQLRVRVTDDGVEVAWGLSEMVRKAIPFREIRKVEPVTYSPLGEFGGWGIRVGLGGRKGWTIRGNRAVRFHLQDGTLFYLGSRRPERLLSWIQSVGKGRTADRSSETSGGVGGSRKTDGR